MSNVSKFAALVRKHVGDPGIIFEFGACDCAEFNDFKGNMGVGIVVQGGKGIE